MKPNAALSFEVPHFEIIKEVSEFVPNGVLLELSLNPFTGTGHVSFQRSYESCLFIEYVLGLYRHSCDGFRRENGCSPSLPQAVDFAMESRRERA